METALQDKGTYTFERDTKNYHRFLIQTVSGATGTLYLPKSLDPLPKRLVLDMRENQDSKN
ncbi:hypothetical protein Dalk_4179 [Desulfatibacillum aliphaticivorans]|uniref:Uncharacterized protein n=1 Tax=Desulfatibacillum aliphaticivorans TaxID=218208 RepID=B8FMZ2_DESAL|nr:hypothetical protein [Desulfatibacillum aliphaticivorans]ACL05862.1 hypothetical protein Dalk_4179 [Desulfatibacillum aliphaticivorans]